MDGAAGRKHLLVQAQEPGMGKPFFGPGGAQLGVGKSDPYFLYFPLFKVVGYLIDLRARNIETLDEIEKTSLDYYASVRSLYRQSRNNEIRNGATEVQDLPDF